MFPLSSCVGLEAFAAIAHHSRLFIISVPPLKLYGSQGLCKDHPSKLIAVLVPAVKKGDRIAQLILERIMTPEVEEVEELNSTTRGSGGYGSTGVAN